MPHKKPKTLTFRDVNTSAFKISTTLALLVHIVGIIGFTSSYFTLYRDTTMYNLMLMFLLLLWNENKIGRRFVTALTLAFSVGLLVEVIGVNTGILFGNYTYTDILGMKIFGVPLIIGLNWFKISYAAYISSMILSQYISKRTNGKMKIIFQTPFVFALIAAIITTVFDLLMEPVAIKLGFWQWDNNVVPAFNYVCWFLISFILSRVYFSIRLPHTNGFAVVILLSQSLFFFTLRFIL